jgi:hypothetical protein
MKNVFKGLALTAVIALSMLASTGEAFAKDTKHGRETAWTLPAPDLGLVEEFFGDGVTWEE